MSAPQDPTLMERYRAHDAAVRRSALANVVAPSRIAHGQLAIVRRTALTVRVDLWTLELVTASN